MLQDEEFEEEMMTPERIAALGFKPQSEVIMNHLLPYAADLDAESNKFLKEVKMNLAQAVMFREMKPGCGVWSSRLMRYIRLYGLKFSKEDHITFIKLAYELLLIPDLEPTKIHKFGTMFVMLSKKRNLISPKEMTLPWRPLFDLGKKLFKNNATDIGMYHYMADKQTGKQDVDILQMIRKFLSGSGLDDALNYFGFAKDEKKSTSLECSFVSIVKCARPYFELSATKEILEEILPQINPWSSEVYMIGQLTMFLPVGLPHDLAEYGHKLWFDELMDLWDTCYSAPCGANDLIVLFAGLAKRNPGAVDWSPYAPKMFSKFLSSLHLPVSYKDMHVQSKHSGLDVKYLASWIVWCINPDGVILKHLQCFLDGIESYLHSANSGRWSYRLRDFIRKISREFLNRVRRERKTKGKESWENKTLESYKLRDEDITQFVEMMLNPTLLAVYNRSGSDISIALQNLATLRPAIVIPPLIDRLRNSLTSLTEPHKVTVGMTAVASVARPLLRGPDAGYPEGPTHVVPLLMAILPGLDPNDIKKTLVSLHFIVIYAWMVPFIDCSSAHEYWDDLTEEELLTCESTAQFEDFVLVYIDRLFVMIESSVLENVRLDTKDLEVFRSKTDAIMETAVSSASTAILMQCSPKIFKEALRKFKKFATESTFETNVSGNMVGVLLRVFARVDAEATLAAFLPQLCEELLEHLTDEALKEDNPSRDILYRLVLLGYVVECDGLVLLKYVPRILPVLDRALKLSNKSAQTRACEVLANMLQFFSIVDVKEWRSSSKDYAEAPEKWLPIREWGNGSALKEVNLKWHIPSKEEAECVQMLIDRYLKPTAEKLRQWSAGEITIGRQEMLRTLSIINACLSCTLFFPAPDETPNSLIDSLVPATKLPFSTGVKHVVTIDGENVRIALVRLMTAVQARMLADKSDDTKSFEALIQIWDRILIGRGTRVAAYEAKLRTFGALERAMDGRGSDPSQGYTNAYVRILVADAVRIADETRAEMPCESGITNTALTVLNSLFELSINTYTSVRIAAQNRLTWMFTWVSFSYRLLMPKLKAILEGKDGEESHERQKGALFILMAPRNCPLINKQDWEALRELWPALLKSPLSEKQSIHRLEQLMGEQIHRQLPTINTRLVISDAAVEACKPLLSQSDMSDPTFTSLFNTAMEREKEHWDQVEKHYKDLLQELVDVGNQSNIQWRRLELAMQMLTSCSSLQTHYTVAVVKLCLDLLIHEDITVRRTALKLMHFILKQCKPKLKKVTVDPFEISGCERPKRRTPGYRKDLDWAVWSQDKFPLDDSHWDKPILRNSEYGFYAWPEKLEMAAPAAEQVFVSEDPVIAEVESHIRKFFTDDEKVTKLVGFLSAEEKKGKDKFNGLRFSVMRMLFSHFGEDVYTLFLAHAHKHVTTTLEPSQRFAAEVASAALRAPRYWTRPRQSHLYREVLLLIKSGLATITPETLDDWGTCMATGVDKLDPLRGAEFLEGLVELCVPPACSDDELDTNSSFIICARLFALQGALGTLKWRTAQLAKLILQRLDAANFIQHPFQIVRESVGSLLVTIFDTELMFPGLEHDSPDLPRLADFIETVMPRLAPLYDENGDIVIKLSTSMAVEGTSREVAKATSPEIEPPLVGQVSGIAVETARITPNVPVVDDTSQGGDHERDDSSSDTESSLFDPILPPHKMVMELRLGGDAPAPTAGEHARAANLLTTVLRTCMGITVRAMNTNLCAQYVLSAAACALAGRGSNAEELPRAAAGFLAASALAHHPAPAFDHALATAVECTQDRSWWARLSCLDFAQPLLFYGLPYLCDNEERAIIAENMALQLMQDPRIEVRQSAAKLLTGLMHCRALPDEEKTLRTLTRSCRSKELVERHYGVLGLCSYLSSRPYSIGPKLGNVLAELARHTNAPDPIPATIRTALAEFRRTHQDDWQKHRDQLSEEELDLLADLTSPPCYCA